MKRAWTLFAAASAVMIAAPALAQTGACCLPPCFECVIMTEEDCLNQQGLFFGEDSTCDPAP